MFGFSIASYYLAFDPCTCNHGDAYSFYKAINLFKSVNRFIYTSDLNNVSYMVAS